MGTSRLRRGTSDQQLLLTIIPGPGGCTPPRRTHSINFVTALRGSYRPGITVRVDTSGDLMNTCPPKVPLPRFKRLTYLSIDPSRLSRPRSLNLRIKKQPPIQLVLGIYIVLSDTGVIPPFCLISKRKPGKDISSSLSRQTSSPD